MFAFNDADPTDVFSIPVVFAAKALTPIAVLYAPSRFASNVPYPNAVF